MEEDKKKKRHYAAIDIGSNAVRLLIKSVNDPDEEEWFTKEQLLRVHLRLGEEAFKLSEISEKKVKNLIRLLKAFLQLMKIYEVQSYRACATSAMRDARNGQEITRRIFKKTGIQIDIISGKEEARVIYDNHIENMLKPDKNYLYVDVGGGSTEISLITDSSLKFSKSYNVGTVRMLQGMVKAEDYAELQNDVRSMASKHKDLIIIGSGGNINKLFRLSDSKSKKNCYLTTQMLEKLSDNLKQYTPEERRRVFKLKPDRSEVIVPAAEIFLEVAHSSQAKYIWVPIIGLADGIIDSLYSADQTEKELAKS